MAEDRLGPDGHIGRPGGHLSRPVFRNNDMAVPVPNGRVFPSGATRDTEMEKLDYDAFLAPEVLERYAQYMHRHRRLADGTLRDGDDWQRGIPVEVYRKSLWRHHVEAWKLGRAGTAVSLALEEALCAIIFNASGWLLELLKRR